MHLLSIDPNTKDTGLVLWADGKPIKTCSINFRRADRLMMVHRIATRAFECRAEVIAVEDCYAGDNPYTAIMLAKLIGGIESVAREAGLDVIMLAATEIDKACDIPYGLSRKERKERLKAFGSLELGRGLVQDIYDAYAVGIAALGVLKERQDASKYRMCQ